MKRILILISIVTISGLMVSLATIFVGLYVAIWADKLVGGKIVATAFVTAVLMTSIGLPIHEFIKKNGGY